MVAGIAGGIGTLAENQGWISKTGKLGDTFGFGGSTPTATTPAPTVGNQTPGNQAQGTITASDQAARNAEMAQANQNAAATRAGGSDRQATAIAGRSSRSVARRIAGYRANSSNDGGMG